MNAFGRIRRRGTVTVNEIARTIHRAVEALTELQGHALYPKWEYLRDEDRALYTEGVLEVIANPDWTPEQAHDFWVENRLRAGWTYGPEKDYIRKTHPSMVPSHELPEIEQVKDVLFIAMVRAMSPFMQTARL